MPAGITVLDLPDDLSPVPDDYVYTFNDDGLDTKARLSDIKKGISLDLVNNTSDENKPVSTAQLTALDLKTNIETFGPLSLATSDHFKRERSTLAEVIRGAEHCYFCNEAGTAYVDRVGSLNLSVNGVANNSASGGRFRESRSFNGTNQFGLSASNTTRAGRPFWGVIGVNFADPSTDGICGEGTSGTTLNWYLSKIGNIIRFTVRRMSTTVNFDVVEVAGVTSGVDYVIAFRNDSTGLYLYVSEVGEAYDHASLVSGSAGFDLTNYPLNIGRSFVSTVATNSHMNGKIGFFAYGFGQLSERSIDALTSAQAVDFATLKTDLPKTLKRYRSVLAIGDSLTTESFADPNTFERATTLHSPLWRAEISGIGGQTAVPVIDRFLTYPLSNIERKVVAFWIGNNSASQRQIVIDAAFKGVHRALIAGAERVLILGCPNRTVTDATFQTIATLQGHLDFINAGLSEIAASDSRVYYIDVQDWFINPANYTPIGSNDISDQSRGIVPRSTRDSPASSESTHFGPVGASHLANRIVTFLPT